MDEVVIGLMDELKELRREVAELRAAPSTSVSSTPVPSTPAATISSSAGQIDGLLAQPQAGPSAATVVPSTSAISGIFSLPQLPVMLASPIPSSALPDIDIVPPNIKRDILHGKDINLAILLLPLKDRRYAYAERDIQIGEEVLSLKPRKDNRLCKDLTISEFITAFNIYKRVLCSQYPNRRDELDEYLSFVIDISAKFPGFSFYHYHLQFSAKAAEYFQRGVRLDWASPDPTMLNRIVAG